MKINPKIAPYPVFKAAVSTACLSIAVLLAAPAAGQAQNPCGPSITVQAGETMFSIAQRCDTTVETLQQANPHVDPHNMAVGMTLQIAAEPGELRPEAPETTATVEQHYTVQPGDTPAGIAATHGITLETLLAANPELDPHALRVGQTIVLPPEPGVPTPPGIAPPAEPDDRHAVSGVMTDEGVECQAMRGRDGQLYTLIGELEGYGAGEAVEVRGTEPEVDLCLQGITIEVEEIRRLG